MSGAAADSLRKGKAPESLRPARSSQRSTKGKCADGRGVAARVADKQPSTVAMAMAARGGARMECVFLRTNQIQGNCTHLRPPPILLTSGNCVEFDLGQPPDHSKSRFPRALHWRTTSPRALPSRARFAPTRRCCRATGVDCVTVTSGLAGWPASGQDSFPIRSGSWPESNPEICSTIKDSDD